MKYFTVLLVAMMACTLLWPCTSVESGGAPRQSLSIEGEWTNIYWEGGGLGSSIGDEKLLAADAFRHQQVERWSPDITKITKDGMAAPSSDPFPAGGHYYKLNTKTTPFEIDQWYYPKKGDKLDTERGLCLLKDGFLIVCINPASQDRAKKFTTKQGDPAFLLILRKGNIK